MTPHPLLRNPLPLQALLQGNRFSPFGQIGQLPPGLLQALQARAIPGAMAPMQNGPPAQQPPGMQQQPGMPGLSPGQFPQNIPRFPGGFPGGFPGQQPMGAFNPFGQQPMGAMYPGFQGGGLTPGMANTQPIRGGALSLY